MSNKVTPGQENGSVTMTSKSILDVKTHYKPTETFQYTHFTSCHPPGVKRGFIEGEAIRLLKLLKNDIWWEPFDPKQDIERSLSEVNFDNQTRQDNQR